MSRLIALLFARPSFIEGIARIMDFQGSMSEYNFSTDGQATDQRAIRSDWLRVGADMRFARSEFDRGNLERVS